MKAMLLQLLIVLPCCATAQTTNVSPAIIQLPLGTATNTVRLDAVQQNRAFHVQIPILIFVCKNGIAFKCHIRKDFLENTNTTGLFRQTNCWLEVVTMTTNRPSDTRLFSYLKTWRKSDNKHPEPSREARPLPAKNDHGP